MSGVLSIVLPVFLVVGLGYGAVALRFFDEAATDALARFVFQFALPVMLFRSLAESGPPAGFEIGYLVAFYAGLLVSGGIAWLVAGRWFARPPQARVIAGFGAAYGNLILLGIPLVLTAMGERATLPLFVLITFHGPVLMTLVTILLERSGAEGRLWRRTASGILTNPILVGLLAGIGYGASGLALPELVSGAAELLGRAALPTALFAMGAGLARYRIAGALPLAACIVGLKLMLHPLLVWVLVDHVLGVPKPLADVAILCAAMPVGVNAYLFASRYRAGEAEATTAIIVSTALSVVTISLLIAFRIG